MGSRLSFMTCKVFTIFLLFFSCCRSLESNLSPNFYDNTCPDALRTIRSAVKKVILRERRMAASLIRLHFHDCFVQGCDGSVLLDDTPSMPSEKSSRNNAKSLRGFKVIDEVKARVERICPGIVSCADIIAVAARDATVMVGGPSWKVKLGRKDSTASSQFLADENIPSFDDSLDKIISMFSIRGLSAREMVALSGSHTVGQVQCALFRDRIYNQSSDIDANFAKIRQRNCPPKKGNGDGNLAPLDLKTPNLFDNNYFKDLVKKRGVLLSDQLLYSGGPTDNVVKEYSKNSSLFRSDFAAAMVKMGDIDPLTGSQGEIRRFCYVMN